MVYSLYYNLKPNPQPKQTSTLTEFNEPQSIPKVHAVNHTANAYEKIYY